MSDLPPDFRFDATTHTYYRGTREIPGVTRILDVLDPGRYDGVSDFYQERGTAVHAACAILNDGDVIHGDSIDPSIEGFVEAYRRFLREMRPKILKSEMMVYSASPEFAGRLDIALALGARGFISDIKSGQPTRRVGPQTALYHYAGGWSDTYGRAALWLREDGSYRWMADVDNPDLFTDHDLSAGLSALDVLEWRGRKK